METVLCTWEVQCAETGRRREREARRRVHAGANAWRAVDGVMADLEKTKGQGHEHLCDTGMPVWNGNFGIYRNTTTKVASVRKQLGTKKGKSKDRRIMVALREETGVQRSLIERLVRS